MTCLGNKLKSLCCFWGCTQVLHFGLFWWLWRLLHFFQRTQAHSSSCNGYLNWIHPFPSILVHHFLMSMFSPAVYCLTAFNLHWFVDLISQVPMQSCSLLHWTLLLPWDTTTTEHCFHFGPAALFFLELLVIALYIFPLAYWTPSNLGDLSPMSYGFTFSYCL